MQKTQLFDRFRSSKKHELKPIAPPYFGGEFNCDRCDGMCVSSCKRNVIVFNNNGVSLNFKTNGCNFCQDCAKVCESLGNGVLSLKFDEKITAKTNIDVSTCLAWNDVICYNCQDVCKYKAIEFFGVFRPIINDKCVNCGECVSACFKQSIDIKAE